MSARRRVVVTYPGFHPDDHATVGLLESAGLELRFEPRLRERSPAEVMALMADADAGIVSTDPFDESVFAACPALRVLARVGVGVDSIDLEAATEAGVAVTTTPGLNAATVADHTMAMMLACVRRLVENDSSVRAGGWERGGALSGGDLTGSTIAIVGLGAIGAAVARRLSGFDVQLLGVDIDQRAREGMTRVDLDQALAAADLITVHVPLSAATRGLIGAREMALMRPGSILLNTSRGGVVDEQALIAALREGRIAAAGLDVFAEEPPLASPLLSMSNVLLTPHVAGISVRAQRLMIEQAARSVIAVLEGRGPVGLLNPEALAGAPDPA